MTKIIRKNTKLAEHKLRVFNCYQFKMIWSWMKTFNMNKSQRWFRGRIFTWPIYHNFAYHVDSQFLHLVNLIVVLLKETGFPDLNTLLTEGKTTINCIFQELRNNTVSSKINDLKSCCINPLPKSVRIWSFSGLYFPHSVWIRRDIRIISPYWVRMRENTGLKNSKYWHFSRTIVFPFSSFLIPVVTVTL